MNLSVSGHNANAILILQFFIKILFDFQIVNNLNINLVILPKIIIFVNKLINTFYYTQLIYEYSI